jgi:hypothetical protein
MDRIAWRAAPMITGFAGLGWFWAELAPQRAGFEDTDDPAVSLQFLAAHPGSHAVAGLWLMVASLALIATVLAVSRRFDADASLGREYLRVLGILAGAMLFGMAVVRFGEGPVRYVQGLDETWGETAYLITQFMGTQLLAIGGVLLLAAWITATAWLGAPRGVVPRVLAVLAVFPAVRLLGVLGPFGGDFEGLWLLYMAAVPAAFIWLVLLGAWQLRRPMGAPAQAKVEPVPL